MIAAIDIGATTIKAALVTATGNIESRVEALTPSSAGSDAVLDCVADLVFELSQLHTPVAIGVGSCGLVDARGRVVETTATMPGWAGTDIPAAIKHRTGYFCTADNDGNVAALGEALCGAGRGVRSLAMLVLGTGVGGGIVIDGRIFHGAGSMAGTFGHLCVKPGGRTCACGARGCLEAYASAWAMRRYAGRDAHEVFAQVQTGDSAFAEHIAEAADALGLALASIAHALNPAMIVIGGGVARGWSLLAGAALARFADSTLPCARSSTRIVPASLGSDAGIIGAAMLAAGSLAAT
ncbi:MAG: ROK family protein [Proteobacteria bacterium]|nr:ROK family protein [Pseudomonadota bacterium]